MSERQNKQNIWDDLSENAKKLAGLLRDSQNGWESPHFVERVAEKVGIHLDEARRELEDAGVFIEQPDIKWRSQTEIDSFQVKAYKNESGLLSLSNDYKRVSDEPKYGLEKNFRDSIPSEEE